MSRLLAPARIIMPSRVRLTTAYRPIATTMQASDENTRYHGIGHQLAEAKAAGQPGRRGDAVHVVADEEAARFLEHQDQGVGHQHLLQVVALVEEAEERPLEQVAEDDREHHADQRAG